MHHYVGFSQIGSHIMNTCSNDSVISSPQWNHIFTVHDWLQYTKGLEMAENADVSS